MVLNKVSPHLEISSLRVKPYRLMMSTSTVSPLALIVENNRIRGEIAHSKV
jgi:hypothetical protein